MWEGEVAFWHPRWAKLFVVDRKLDCNSVFQMHMQRVLLLLSFKTHASQSDWKIYSIFHSFSDTIKKDLLLKNDL